jgi:FkbH-like protein
MAARAGSVRCVIWDLDGTIWDGTLLEDRQVTVAAGIRDLVRSLDDHGVLQSVASRNDAALALGKLQELGLADYFTAPQISWNAKSHAVRRVIELLNLSADTVVFVDDSPFERAEVGAELRQVRCFAPDDFRRLAGAGGLLPAAVTRDGRARRRFYQAELRRREHQATFAGPSSDFLSSLGMRMTVRPMLPDDLDRAAELTERTHQLNTTGIVMSAGELRRLMEDPSALVLIARLDDRFGAYGRIGLAVVDIAPARWTVRLLLMSCRVLGRNAGQAFLAVIAGLAVGAGAGLSCYFRPNERNRPMRVTYGLLGFRPHAQQPGLIVYSHPNPAELCVPDYIDARVAVPVRREGGP